MVPDSIKKHALTVSVGTLVAAGAAIWQLATKVAEVRSKWEQRVEDLERDVKWLRRDVQAAVGKPITRYYWESEDGND